MSKPIKLDYKIIKEHISDWSYETKDDLGNKVIKQKGDRSYTPFLVPKKSKLKGMVLCEYKNKEGEKCSKSFYVRYKIYKEIYEKYNSMYLTAVNTNSIPTQYQRIFILC